MLFLAVVAVLVTTVSSDTFSYQDTTVVDLSASFSLDVAVTELNGYIYSFATVRSVGLVARGCDASNCAATLEEATLRSYTDPLFDHSITSYSAYDGSTEKAVLLEAVEWEEGKVPIMVYVMTPGSLTVETHQYIATSGEPVNVTTNGDIFVFQENKTAPPHLFFSMRYSDTSTAAEVVHLQCGDTMCLFDTAIDNLRTYPFYSRRIGVSGVVTPSGEIYAYFVAGNGYMSNYPSGGGRGESIEISNVENVYDQTYVFANRVYVFGEYVYMRSFSFDMTAADPISRLEISPDPLFVTDVLKFNIYVASGGDFARGLVFGITNTSRPFVSYVVHPNTTFSASTAKFAICETMECAAYSFHTLSDGDSLTGPYLLSLRPLTNDYFYYATHPVDVIQEPKENRIITLVAFDTNATLFEVSLTNETVPTSAPTLAPSLSPTPVPTEPPTTAPTGAPTIPTPLPTGAPTIPTPLPTGAPTVPTPLPTGAPTVPSLLPTGVPTTAPTSVPDKKTPTAGTIALFAPIAGILMTALCISIMCMIRNKAEKKQALKEKLETKEEEKRKRRARKPGRVTSKTDKSVTMTLNADEPLHGKVEWKLNRVYVVRD